MDSFLILTHDIDELIDVLFFLLEFALERTHNLLNLFLSAVKSADIIRVGINAVCEGWYSAVKGLNVVLILHYDTFESRYPVVKSSHML